MKDELMYANTRVQDRDLQITTLKQQLDEGHDQLKKSRSEIIKAEGECEKIKREHASCGPEVKIKFRPCSMCVVRVGST